MAERELVADAAGEAVATGTPHRNELGHAWLMLRRDLGTETIYVASRVREEEMLVGRSTARLADRIRQCS